MRTHRILRDRLVSLVDRRWDGGLTLTISGPGMGKSTLVQQAMSESRTLGRGQEWLVRCGRGWGWGADQLEIGLGLGRSVSRPTNSQFTRAKIAFR